MLYEGTKWECYWAGKAQQRKEGQEGSREVAGNLSHVFMNDGLLAFKAGHMGAHRIGACMAFISFFIYIISALQKNNQKIEASTFHLESILKRTLLLKAR